MNPPLSAIAAHWGANVHYEYRYSLSGNWGERFETIGPVLMQGLINRSDYVRNFKLHLKPLASLSEDQVRTLARLAGIDGELQVTKEKDHWYVEGYRFDLAITFNGTLAKTNSRAVMQEFNQAPLIRQLLAWHVFLPGFIEEEYVELVKE